MKKPHRTKHIIVESVLLLDFSFLAQHSFLHHQHQQQPHQQDSTSNHHASSCFLQSVLRWNPSVCRVGGLLTAFCRPSSIIHVSQAVVTWFLKGLPIPISTDWQSSVHPPRIWSISTHSVPSFGNNPTNLSGTGLPSHGTHTYLTLWNERIR